MTNETITVNEDTVYVVYDSKEAIPCVNNIASFIQDKRTDFVVKVISASSFTESMLEHHKVIIVGHGELSFHYLLFLPEALNVFGIKIAGSNQCGTHLNNLLVLRVTHIPENQQSSDTFKRFYNLAASERYRDYAGTYSVPFRYGERNSFQEYQYDLLFLISRPYIRSLIEVRPFSKSKRDTANHTAEKNSDNKNQSTNDETSRTIFSPVCQKALDKLEAFYLNNSEAVVYCNLALYNILSKNKASFLLQYSISEILGYRVKLCLRMQDGKVSENVKSFDLLDKTCYLAVNWQQSDCQDFSAVTMYCNSEFYRKGIKRHNIELLQRCFRRIFYGPVEVRLCEQK